MISSSCWWPTFTSEKSPPQKSHEYKDSVTNDWINGLILVNVTGMHKLNLVSVHGSLSKLVYCWLTVKSERRCPKPESEVLLSRFPGNYGPAVGQFLLLLTISRVWIKLCRSWISAADLTAFNLQRVPIRVKLTIFNPMQGVWWPHPRIHPSKITTQSSQHYYHGLSI